jgi:hypothetical protein
VFILQQFRSWWTTNTFCLLSEVVFRSLENPLIRIMSSSTPKAPAKSILKTSDTWKAKNVSQSTTPGKVVRFMVAPIAYILFRELPRDQFLALVVSIVTVGCLHRCIYPSTNTCFMGSSPQSQTRQRRVRFGPELETKITEASKRTKPKKVERLPKKVHNNVTPRTDPRPSTQQNGVTVAAAATTTTTTNTKPWDASNLQRLRNALNKTDSTSDPASLGDIKAMATMIEERFGIDDGVLENPDDETATTRNTQDFEGIHVTMGADALNKMYQEQVQDERQAANVEVPPGHPDITMEESLDETEPAFEKMFSESVVLDESMFSPTIPPFQSKIGRTARDSLLLPRMDSSSTVMTASSTGVTINDIATRRKPPLPILDECPSDEQHEWDEGTVASVASIDEELVDDAENMTRQVMDAFGISKESSTRSILGQAATSLRSPLSPSNQGL